MDVNVTNTIGLYLTAKMCECEESVFFLVCAVPLQSSVVKSCWVASYHQVPWLCRQTHPGTLEIHFFMTHDGPRRLHYRNILLLLLTYWFIYLDIL